MLLILFHWEQWHCNNPTLKSFDVTLQEIVKPLESNQERLKVKHVRKVVCLNRQPMFALNYLCSISVHCSSEVIICNPGFEELE